MTGGRNDDTTQIDRSGHPCGMAAPELVNLRRHRIFSAVTDGWQSAAMMPRRGRLQRHLMSEQSYRRGSYAF
jgi:hypothetical protein